jgi:hypothetical protein
MTRQVLIVFISEVRADFLEYLQSENSEEFFIMLQKKEEDVISLVEFNP